MSLKDKSILVFDNGLFPSFAQRMAAPDGFGEVFYLNSWMRGRPTFKEIVVGKGYDGITVVKNEWEDALIDSVDVIAFPDCYDGERQDYLREHGKAVWGGGSGVMLELNRLYAKRTMKSVGLPVGPYKVVKGVKALRKVLEENEDLVLKISFLRGLMETRKHQKWWLSKTFVDGLEYKLGPLAEEQEFIVEEIIETELEVGADSVFVGKFPEYSINGVEIKDEAYLGMVQQRENLPDVILKVNEALEPVLSNFGYANFFSSEVRRAKDGTGYPIDLTCRQGSPSGEAQLATWKNIPEIVYRGANGEQAEPEWDYKFVAQAMIFNKGDEHEWCGVGIPKNIRSKVNLYYGMRKGEEDYIVPQQNPMDELGSVIGQGDTAKEAIDQCKEHAEQLEGDICVKVEELDAAVKEFETMREKGLIKEAVAA